MVRLDLVRAWRNGGAGVDVLRLAGVLPHRIARQIAEQYAELDYPGKGRDARTWAAAWYVATVVVLDALREIDHNVPELEHLPDEIERLQKIARGA